MAYLDEIINDINSIEDSIFQFDRELENTMKKIENIGFLGQVDHNVLYMAMLHQVQNNKGVIHTVTPEEAEEYYSCYHISKWCGFEPFAWTLWFFNMEKDYIRALVSFNADKNLSIKDNYGNMYNELKPNVVTKIPRRMIYETKIHCTEYKDIWLKLKEVVKYGKNNEIPNGGFNKKVFYDTARYFGDRPQDKATLLDDEYKSTMPPERITLPVKHIPQDIRYDVKALKIIRGASFLQIDFEKDGYIKKFDNIKDLNSYFYSLIDYINSGVEPEIQHIIPYLEKHYFSNKLGFNNPEKVYKVKMTKFLECIVVEAEIAEFGIYYRISNWNGKEFCKHV